MLTAEDMKALSDLIDKKIDPIYERLEGMDQRFDGIDKRVLINGAPGAQRCEFLSFPSLVPGENRFDTPDPVTVAYYPAYL